jgi:hypothetical protein
MYDETGFLIVMGVTTRYLGTFDAGDRGKRIVIGDLSAHSPAASLTHFPEKGDF